MTSGSYSSSTTPPVKDACPSCGEELDFEWVRMDWDEDDLDDVKSWVPSSFDAVRVWFTKCPACTDIIIDVQRGREAGSEAPGTLSVFTETRVVPKGGRSIGTPATSELRRAVPDGVPLDLAQDYTEAALTLSVSPKASAALSRRCLQHLCTEYLGSATSNLDRAIAEVMASGQLAHMNRAFDAVRMLGNIAAHPTKSKDTGIIVDVDPGEAEAILDVLHEALDTYFAAPARAEAIRARINKKLVEAGRSPLD